jgi:hypothetical protein
MILTILVPGPKQPGDHIDVYLRPLVDDLKILWKPGVPEFWDEYKREEFIMHGMLFTTINDNLAQRNLSGQSKRKGATCPHYLEDTCAIWLRHSKKYVFMGHRRFLSKKLSGILPGYSCKEGRIVEDGLLVEFPCTPTRTRSVYSY